MLRGGINVVNEKEKFVTETVKKKKLENCEN